MERTEAAAVAVQRDTVLGANELEAEAPLELVLVDEVVEIRRVLLVES